MMNPGTYYGEAVSGELKQAKTGTVYFDVAFNITHRAEGGQWVPEQGKGWVKFFFTEKAEKRSMEELSVLGFNGSFGDARFANPQQTLTCERDGQFDRWRLDTGTSGGSGEAGSDVIARFNARWAARNSQSAPVPAGGTVPQSTSFAQTGAVAQPAPAPAPAPDPDPTPTNTPPAAAIPTPIDALPGTEEDIPF